MQPRLLVLLSQKEVLINLGRLGLFLALLLGFWIVLLYNRKFVAPSRRFR